MAYFDNGSFNGQHYAAHDLDHKLEYKDESLKHARAAKRLYEEGKRCTFETADTLFRSAIEEFTLAIRKYPQCPSYLSSRAQCYLELAEYMKVVADCDEALRLLECDNAIDLLKILLRKGKALHGLQRFDEALVVLRQAAKIAPNQPEITEEIEILRNLSNSANIPKVNFATVAAAASSVALLPPPVQCQRDPLEDPANPLHAVTIWVGNFPSKKAKSTSFLKIFEKYGPVKSYIVLPEKSCGIVTLYDWKKAALAMNELQNYPFNGLKLKLKFKVEKSYLQNKLCEENRPCSSLSQVSESRPSSCSFSSEKANVHLNTEVGAGSVLANNAIWIGFGSAPLDVTEDDIRDHFICCGAIKCVSLLRDSGCAFVNFMRPVSVQTAVNTFNGTSFKNRTLRVERKIELNERDTSCDAEIFREHQPNETALNTKPRFDNSFALWVGNLYDPMVKKEHLEQLFNEFNALSIHMLTEKSHCAFVNFKSKAEAATAQRHCDGACVGPNGLRITVQMKIAD